MATPQNIEAGRLIGTEGAGDKRITVVLASGSARNFSQPGWKGKLKYQNSSGLWYAGSAQALSK